MLIPILPKFEKPLEKEKSEDSYLSSLFSII